MTLFSPPLSAQDETVLREHYDLRFEVSPFRDQAIRRGVYDPSDAFYVPIAAGGDVIRPGTLIRIYRTKP